MTLKDKISQKQNECANVVENYEGVIYELNTRLGREVAEYRQVHRGIAITDKLIDHFILIIERELHMVLNKNAAKDLLTGRIDVRTV
jgi:hypothetical protein